MDDVAFDEYTGLRKRNYSICDHGFGSKLAIFGNNALDILQSIELDIQQIFFEINESETASSCTRIDIIKIDQFFSEWVNKPEFKAFPFEAEIRKNTKKLREIIQNSRDLYSLNKPEVEKIKIVQSYFEKMSVFQVEIKKEFQEIEKSFTIESDFPVFEKIFQKSVKFLTKVSKLVSRIRKFKLLFAVNSENVNTWVESGLISTRKFKNMTEATAQLVDNFVDLEGDIKIVDECSFEENDDKVVF